MHAFFIMLTNVLLFSALMIPGLLLGKCRKFERSAVPTLTNILMYVGMPFLVLSKLMQTDIRNVSAVSLLMCAAFAVGFVLVLCLFCKWIGKWNGFFDHHREATFCSAFSNCGFMGIPLVSTMFPNQPEITVYVSLFNVFTTFMLWSLGVYILSGDRTNVSVKRMLLNPVTLAILIGSVIAVTGWGKSVSMLDQYASVLAGITTPLSMMVLGFQFSDMRLDGILRQRSTYLTVFLKLIVHPLLAILCMRIGSLFFDLSVEFEIAMLVATAVPTAASAPAMAQTYGADGSQAAKLTVATTVFSLVTLPLMYWLFQLL